MYGDDGPDDDGSEHFLEAGWMPAEEVEELRELFKHVEWPEGQTPGYAALVLLDHILNPPGVMVGDQLALDTWAKVKLGRW
jgi:hypothetical protein